jgi:hypothetical protein
MKKDRELVFVKYKVSAWDGENFLEMDEGVGCTAM